MKKILLFVLFTFITQKIEAQTEAFITTWVTTTGSETITLSAQADAPNYTINWGDDSAINTYDSTQTPSHLYVNSGEHTILIMGTFPHLTFVGQTKLKAVQQWGTQKWTSMANMFQDCTTFNSFPIQAPDLSLCTNMSAMFSKASAFNQPIGSWNVSSVTNMSKMFYKASAFNQPIGNWIVSSVTDMSNMLYSAKAFNQPIGLWNVSSVTNMSNMLYSATAFNQPIGDWKGKVSSVTNMSNMFFGATAFNQPIGLWDVSSVTNMSGMFVFATVFNQPIGDWKVSRVTNMSSMFYKATAFNQPIMSWIVCNVTNMSSMFAYASAFNQPIGSWELCSVTNMSKMFTYATAFSQPIGSWNVSNVTDMSSMFAYTSAFNQPIGSWNVSSVTNMSNMFIGAKLTTANYDSTLTDWATKGANGGVKQGVTFSGGTSNYCNGLSARNILIDKYGWIITDSGSNCNSLETEVFDKSSLCQYPNPASTVINVKVDANIANKPFNITDTLGRIVLKGKLNEDNTTINVEHLSKGIYFIKIANNKASKFIKE